MMKQLSIALALVFSVACKPDASSPAKSAGDDTSAKPRSAKIDVKPALPPTAAEPPAAEPPAPSLPTDDQPPAAAPPPAAGAPRAADSRLGDTPARKDFRRRRNAGVDTNGDGVISQEERDAAMRERATGMHSQLDTDGDGKVSPAELANARGRMRFDNPAELDTNGDGDISADELAAGLKARREQRRGAAGSAAPGAGQITP